MEHIKFWTRYALEQLDREDIIPISEAAERLLVLTAAVESDGRHVVQVGGGPALGLWQMEPDTAEDIYKNYLRYRSRTHEFVVDQQRGLSVENALRLLPVYGAVMARLHYRRAPQRLPDENDAFGMAAYWKDHYNTHLGAGKIEKAERCFRRLYPEV